MIVSLLLPARIPRYQERVGRPPHQLRSSDVLRETPAPVERQKLGLADKLDAAHRSQPGVADDRIEQHVAHARMSGARRNDHVENDGQVDTIRENPGEPHQSIGRPLNQGEDKIGRHQHRRHVVRVSVRRPPLRREQLHQLRQAVAFDSLSDLDVRTVHRDSLPGRERLGIQGPLSSISWDGTAGSRLSYSALMRYVVASLDA